MKLSFSIDYRTNWGESVYITGNIPELGNGDLSQAVKLELDGVESWSTVIEVDDKTPDFEYRYIVKHENGYVKHEWGTPHKFLRARTAKTYEIYDRWQDTPLDKPYYSSAFIDCILNRPDRYKPLAPKSGCVNIRVSAPMVRPDEVVAICGDNDALGDWNPANAVVMNDANYPEWSVNLELKALQIPFSYKFLILKRGSLDLVAWEGGDNRYFDLVPEHKSAVMVVSGMRLINSLAPWRGAGVAIPVFSVRSNDDFGVGDFYDLIKMVDWAAMTGQKVLQILPINDTTMTNTWVDSYPYNANSTFALHPMYLRLSTLGRLANEERQAYYDNLGRELNQLKEVDYERVNAAKTAFTREIYAQQGAETINSADFIEFVTRNGEWLTPYAAFCVLRDLNNTPDFTKWGEYAEYKESKVAEFIAAHQDEINFVYYQQYHLDRQLREVRDYAHQHEVLIKGDIPIGISRNSVDAWISPRLFNMDCQAGAPPDDFSVLGQNWGFPTYNWEEMNKDGFAWWKARFRKMAEYFDAYRIDHVLGFFRIWQIPMDALHGLLGVFNPALPFTPDELKYNYDFWLDVNLQTTPYIMDYFLGDFFGEYTDEARERFLVPVSYGRYRLRDEFDTQRKVADYFAGQEKNDKNDKLCNALLGLIDQVLFVEDPYERGKYHPRISAQFTYTYRALNDYEKWCFDRLYNDFYYHRHNDFWYGKAMWKLPPLINATDMLVCAEDLGMIPDCVPAVMSQLQILSLEIQRMPKDPRAEFGNTWTYPYLSVCTTSTHDMGGIRQWWEEDHDKAQRYYNQVLHVGGAAPYFAEPWICDKIVDLQLKSPSMLAILPLQDWLSINGDIRRENPQEEQINVPANPRHYWRYRMHLTIEDLLGKDQFNSYLHDKIAGSGR
ncbi:MAG: 4-alpha-glucanotransferase [Pseudoflavonifractor sp.]|nr:4-alpha-glucanotransferase [Pseudoflavonifractor sp.]